MADFEDANSPTWANLVEGQAQLHRRDRAARSRFETPEGKQLPAERRRSRRCWCGRAAGTSPRSTCDVDGAPMSARSSTSGCTSSTTRAPLLERGTRPVLLPAQAREPPRGARSGTTSSRFAEERLGMPRGTIRATVLIETILAAFEMDEILCELREHAAGLNCGPLGLHVLRHQEASASRPEFVLPDRAQVTMTAPFMRAYAELLVQTCHQRGAHAIGGMAALHPESRRPEAERAGAGEGARRQAARGRRRASTAPGSRIPTSCPSRRDFRRAMLGAEPARPACARTSRSTPSDLLDVRRQRATSPRPGCATTSSVGLRYLEAWLRGTGACAIHNLMEDAATAEIARAQVWQWIRHGATLDDGDAAHRARSIAPGSSSREPRCSTEPRACRGARALRAGRARATTSSNS